MPRLGKLSSVTVMLSSSIEPQLHRNVTWSRRNSAKSSRSLLTTSHDPMHLESSQVPTICHACAPSHTHTANLYKRGGSLPAVPELELGVTEALSPPEPHCPGQHWPCHSIQRQCTNQECGGRWPLGWGRPFSGTHCTARCAPHSHQKAGPGARGGLGASTAALAAPATAGTSHGRRCRPRTPQSQHNHSTRHAAGHRHINNKHTAASEPHETMCSTQHAGLHHL